MRNKKAYLQISFSWLFALVVGAFILFLAIFAASKIINLGETETSAKTGTEIGILLNPLETGFETAKSTSFTMPVDTRIYSKCNSAGTFGKQLVSVSQKSFNKWTDTNLEVSFENKYIFSEKFAEGKKFYVFSKPFEFPFKVSDLIYLTSASDIYCFINPPEEIAEEISEDISQNNFLVNNCTENSIKVCFSDSKCDVYVNYNSKYVEKNKEKMYFEGDTLMYAAIFSSPEIYECQLQRLMKRVENLALIYEDKAKIVECDSELNLVGLINVAKNYDKSVNLNPLVSLSEEIKDKNELNSECRLW